MPACFGASSPRRAPSRVVGPQNGACLTRPGSPSLRIPGLGKVNFTTQLRVEPFSCFPPKNLVLGYDTLRCWGWGRGQAGPAFRSLRYTRTQDRAGRSGEEAREVRGHFHTCSGLAPAMSVQLGPRSPVATPSPSSRESRRREVCVPAKPAASPRGAR